MLKDLIEKHGIEGGVGERKRVHTDVAHAEIGLPLLNSQTAARRNRYLVYGADSPSRPPSRAAQQPVPNKSAKKPLELLREEADLIVRRAADPALGKPRYGLKNLKWYLDLSKNWGVCTLEELFKQPPGDLLGVGACYGRLYSSTIMFRHIVGIAQRSITPRPLDLVSSRCRVKLEFGIWIGARHLRFTGHLTVPSAKLGAEPITNPFS